MYLVLKAFRDIWPSNKENPSVCWHATLSCPLMASYSFRSRSDLVVDADHALDFLSYLAFQVCISFYSVLDKSGAWMFLPCSIKNAVAHMVSSRWPSQKRWESGGNRGNHRHDENHENPKCRTQVRQACIGTERWAQTFFCTNFLNTPGGPGHPGNIPGTSQVPPFKTQGRQTFEEGRELFDPHPFVWKTPSPPGSLQTQEVNLCVLLSCLKAMGLEMPDNNQN